MHYVAAYGTAQSILMCRGFWHGRRPLCFSSCRAIHEQGPGCAKYLLRIDLVNNKLGFCARMARAMCARLRSWSGHVLHVNIFGWQGSLCGIHAVHYALQGKHIDAFAAHPGTAHTAIWDKMDKGKVEGVAFDLTAKVCMPS